MRSLEVLETIAWLERQFEPISTGLFDSVRDFALRRQMRDTETEPTRPDPLVSMLSAFHNAGAVMERVRQNEAAVKVLDAFDLSRLCDSKFISQLFLVLLAPGHELKGDRDSFLELYNEHAVLTSRWHNLISCRAPLEMLIVPPELHSPEAADSLLSFELTDRAELTSNVILEVLKSAEALYQNIAKSYDHVIEGPLVLVKVESGSGLTLSFKGVADVVKEVKNCIIAIWNNHRHKKVDEVINHNRAVASTIDVVSHIDSRVKNKSISPEDGERLKRAVVNNTLTLFKDGALITSISRVELVANHQLLQGFSAPKLLEASSSKNGDADGTSPTVPAQRKRAAKKKPA